jgi:hypothetical protein
VNDSDNKYAAMIEASTRIFNEANRIKNRITSLKKPNRGRCSTPGKQRPRKPAHSSPMAVSLEGHLEGKKSKVKLGGTMEARVGHPGVREKVGKSLLSLKTKLQNATGKKLERYKNFSGFGGSVKDPSLGL